MSSEMIINRENYESFFLDYLEGRLDEELRPQLRLFLEENPDLAAELEGLDEIILHPGIPSDHPSKGDLKKKLISASGIDEENIDNMLIASLEGDLDETEEQYLVEFLQQNEAFRYDQKLYKATISNPDKGIIFPEKASLKRRKGAILPFRTMTITAAAIIILLLGWRIFLSPDVPVPLQDEMAPLEAAIEKPQPFNMDILTTATGKDLVQVTQDSPEMEPREVSTVARPVPVNMKAITAIRLESREPLHLVIPRYYSSDVLTSLPPVAEEERSPGLLGKVFRNFGQKARERTETMQEITRGNDRKVNFWTIADLGVKGYNKLTDRDVELEVVKDAEGHPTEYNFRESDRLLLSRDLNQP